MKTFKQLQEKEEIYVTNLKKSFDKLYSIIVKEDKKKAHKLLRQMNTIWNILEE